MKTAETVKAKMYATKEGALYIKREELFSLKRIQDLIHRMAKMKVKP